MSMDVVGVSSWLLENVLAECRPATLGELVANLVDFGRFGLVNFVSVPSRGLDYSPVPLKITPQQRPSLDRESSEVVSMEVATAVADQANGDAVLRWAKTHRWSSRVRLAAPWRWGLLPRLMKGRWQ
jgi:hypothetical protein